MDPVRNPFMAGAGVQPPELAGRSGLLERTRITLERVRAGRGSKSFIAVGLRGVGKTVLLNRAKQMADDLGYRTSSIEAHEQKSLPELLAPALRRIILDLDRLGALSEQAKRALRVFKGFLSTVKPSYGGAELALDVDPEAGTADSGDLEADLPELFVALGKAAAARHTPIAIFVDEIQYLSERDMSALIMAIHKVVQENLPVLLIAAGLPQVVALSGRSKSYAERLFDFPQVDALGHDDALLALSRPVASEGGHFEPAALENVVRITKGYPYFLQEWGYHTWNAAATPVIGVADVAHATDLALQRLDESFFRVRFDRLTPRERDYLRAMAELGPGPHRSGDIADTLKIAVQKVGPLRSGLIGKGMIYSPAHGDTAFTMPLFDEFLHRIIPIWQSPYPRSGPT